MDDAAGNGPAEHRPAAAVPRAVLVLVGPAAAVVLCIGLRAASWLVGPVFLALVIVITVHPVHAALRRRGLPSWVATGVLVLLIYGVLVALAGLVVVSVARLATVLPQYADRAGDLVRGLTDRLAGFGVGRAELRDLAGSLDYGALVRQAVTLLTGLAGKAGTLVFLLSVLLFLSIESVGADARLAAIAADRPPIAAALARFTWGTRRFLGVTTVFGLLTGLVDMGALLVLGIPLAALWGLLAAVGNYIPYVGFFIGLVPPALLALLDSGWRTMLVLIAFYLVVNFVLTSLVQPRFVGHAVDLSVTVTLVALVFWAWLLGPLGAVLAIPLTLLAKALLVDADPRARWAGALLGSTAAVRSLPARPPAAAGLRVPAPRRAGPAPSAAEPVAVLARGPAGHAEWVRLTAAGRPDRVARRAPAG